MARWHWATQRTTRRSHNLPKFWGKKPKAITKVTLMSHQWTVYHFSGESKEGARDAHPRVLGPLMHLVNKANFTSFSQNLALYDMSLVSLSLDLLSVKTSSSKFWNSSIFDTKIWKKSQKGMENHSRLFPIIDIYRYRSRLFDSHTRTGPLEIESWASWRV